MTIIEVMQIAFPILIVACAVALAHLLFLFKIGPSKIHRDVVIPVVALLFFLYTGRLLDVRSMSPIRNFLTIAVIQNVGILTVLCILFAIILVIFVLLCAASETLTFIPSVDIDVDLYKVKRNKAHQFGVATGNAPLSKRFVAGKRHFRFYADGFEHCNTVIPIGISIRALIGIERRISVDLCAIPDFMLFRPYIDEMDELLGKGVYNLTSIEGILAKTVVFSLACSSPTPLWIGDIFWRVMDVQPLRTESNFPLPGRGGGGPTPLEGNVKLEPKPGLYHVSMKSQTKLGRGIDPDMFRIRTFSEPGYRYTIRLELQWTDTQNHHRGDSYGFADELQLDYFDLVSWVDLIRTSKEVKIFSDMGTLRTIVGELYSFDHLPTYSILAIDDGHVVVDLDEAEAWEHIVRIPDDGVEPITKIVGEVEARRWSGTIPRGFFIIDKRTLVLQYVKANKAGFAEIIEDANYIAKVEQTYDTLFEHYKSGVPKP